MELDTFLLLAGFALTKLGLAATIVWLGLRSGTRPGDDEGEGFGGSPADDPPPFRSARRRPRRAPARGGPARSPARRSPRIRA